MTRKKESQEKQITRRNIKRGSNRVIVDGWSKRHRIDVKRSRNEKRNRNQKTNEEIKKKMSRGLFVH